MKSIPIVIFTQTLILSFSKLMNTATEIMLYDLVADYIYNFILQTLVQDVILNYAKHIKISKSWHAKFSAQCQ